MYKNIILIWLVFITIFFEEQEPFYGKKTIKSGKLSDSEIKEFKKLVNGANGFDLK